MNRPSSAIGLLAAAALSSAVAAQSPLRRVDRFVPADLPFAFADYDADGDPDALGWTNGAFDGRVLVNDGHATFTAVPTVGLAIPGVARPAQILGADFNGDGYGDVLVHDQGGFGTLPGNVLFYGGPGFAFTPAPPLPATPLAPGFSSRFVSAAASLDADADGDLDLAVATAGYSGGWVDTPAELWLNVGAAGFVAVVPGAFGGGASPSERVTVHDLDGDGATDVVFGGGFAGVGLLGLSAYRNVGGSFVAAAGYPLSVFNIVAQSAGYAYGDFDGDGLADLAYVSAAGSTSVNLGVQRGTTAGPAAPILSLFLPPTSYPGTGGLRAVDVDGDGLDELMLGGSVASGVTFVDVAATGAIGPIVGAYSGAFLAGEPRDLDQDGDFDLPTTTTVGGSAVFQAPGALFNDGTGSFTAVTTVGGPHGVLSASTGTGHAEVGDLDGDGLLDVLGLAAAPTAAVFLRAALSDGVGGFSYPAGYSIGAPFGGAPLLTTRNHVLADFDLDGDLDYFMRGAAGNFSTSPVVDAVFLNQGGAFGPPTTTSPTIPPTCWGCFGRSVACDLDRDGRPDVVSASFAASVAQVSYSAGGLPGAAVALGALQTTSELLTGDFDGDGYVDVLQLGRATGVAGPQTSYLHAAQPGGPSTIALPGFSGDFAAAGDLNGDAATDVVVDGVVYFFFGGVPVVGPTLPSPLRAPAILVDLDGDGDRDLVEAPGTVMMNQGAAVFGAPEAVLTRFPATPPGFLTSLVARTDFRVTAGDVDRDGDLDVIAPGPIVLLNTTRQLAVEGPPRLGRPTGVRLFGTPGQPFALYVAAGPAQFALPPFGTVLIDPASVVLAAAGSFAPSGAGGAGQALATFAIPVLPALAGFPLHWQAIDFGTAAFTNRLSETIGVY